MGIVQFDIVRIFVSIIISCYSPEEIELTTVCISQPLLFRRNSRDLLHGIRKTHFQKTFPEFSAETNTWSDNSYGGKLSLFFLLHKNRASYQKSGCRHLEDHIRNGITENPCVPIRQ